MKKEKIAQYVRSATPNGGEDVGKSSVSASIFMNCLAGDKMDTICILKSSLSEYAPYGFHKVKDRIKEEIVSFDVKSLREKLTEEEKLLLEYLMASH